MKSDIPNEIYAGVAEESLSIEVTTRCNSACSYCFARAGISRESSLPVDLVKEIIAEGFQASYRQLHITGGEPLLWDGLFESLEYAFVSGYKRVLLNTNGTLLTSNVINGLKVYDGLVLSVSLQGSTKTHERMRGEGSYGRTIKGVERALESGLSLLIYTVVGKTLLAELARYVDDLYKRFPEIQHLSLIQLIRVTNDVFDLSHELLDPEDFILLVKTVSLLNLFGLKTDVMNNPLAGVTAKVLGTPWISRSKPLHHPGSLIVMANRDICLAHSSRDGFGKYRPGMIREVLASNTYQRAVSPDESTCGSCLYIDLCRAGGMDRPSEWFRDMHPETPYCKRVLDRASR